MKLRALAAKASTWLSLPRQAGPEFRAFAAKQELAKPGRYYGDGGTIHDSTHVDVVVNDEGVVTEVWFRCQQLPFRATYGDPGPLISQPRVRLTGVEVLDLEGS